MSNPVEKQQIWRTISNDSHNGVFIWEVLQVTGDDLDNNPFTYQWLKCLDGSYIYMGCYHLWATKEEAKTKYDALSHFDKYNTVTYIE